MLLSTCHSAPSSSFCLLKAVCLVGLLLASGRNLAADDEEPLSFSFTQHAPGEKYDIDDFRLHAVCMGEGDTTVLFEAGLGGSAMEWIPVQELIAGRVRACIYDRAGYAWSDPSPFTSHARELAREADILLDRLGANGPLLLVGHSFGGFVIRELALRRKASMIGMVLVDASHENQLVRLEALEGKTMMPRGDSFVVSQVQVPDSLPVELRRKIQAFSRMRKTYAALHSEMEYFRESARQVSIDRTVVDYPITVIRRGLNLYPANELGRKKTSIWKELQEDLAKLSLQSTLLVAENSGHHVHTDNPALIASAIEDILDAMLPSEADQSK